MFLKCNQSRWKIPMNNFILRKVAGYYPAILRIIDSLTGIIKDFVEHFFTILSFYTPWNDQKNLWFSDLFREYKTGTLGGNRFSILTHFSPVFLCYTPCKRQKTLGFLVFPRGYKNGTLEMNGLTYKLFMSIFTKFKNSFFQGTTFSNCVWIFKRIAKESLLHRVPGVHKQVGIADQVNTLQTQWIEITLIQCCFNITTLKQRWINIISTGCACGVISQKRTRKTFAMACNLSKITFANSF